MNLEESGGSWFTNSSFKILMTLSTSRGIEMAIVFGGGGNDWDGMMKQLPKAYQRKAWQGAAQL